MILEAVRRALRARSEIPFDMFELERTARDLSAQEKLRGLYHKGQEAAWDGRAVLADLVAKHGGVHMETGTRDALSRIFEVLLWGELTAWKVSAELADLVEPLEAKMALTSQAHDEARHFYVLHDYLQLIGYKPRGIDFCAQMILDRTIQTRSRARKLLGLQLLIEVLALTIFDEVRRLRVEPVLADLLVYYEKDEARHVGLGTQYLPELLRDMPRVELVGMALFQIELLAWTLGSAKGMEADLARLGISIKDVIRRGQQKQRTVFAELWSKLGGRDLKVADDLVTVAQELAFPDPGDRGLFARLKRARANLRERDAVPGAGAAE